MKNSLPVWIREYRTIFPDNGTLLILVGAIATALFFYPFFTANERLKHLPVAIVDMSHSHVSRELTQMMASNQFIFVARKKYRFDRARSALERGAVGGIIYIPDTFETSVLQGKSAWISIYSDPASFQVYKQVLTRIYTADNRFAGGIDIRRIPVPGTP